MILTASIYSSAALNIRISDNLMQLAALDEQFYWIVDRIEDSSIPHLILKRKKAKNKQTESIT